MIKNIKEFIVKSLDFGCTILGTIASLLAVTFLVLMFLPIALIIMVCDDRPR
jgi:hypothetical protein